MAVIPTCILLQGNPINKHRDLGRLFPMKPTNANRFIRRLCFALLWSGSACELAEDVTEERTCKKDPAALQRRRLVAQGKRASSLSNYTRVCAGVNRKVCWGTTGMSKALMRILCTPNARLSEYFSRRQHFQSRVTRVQTKMFPDFGRLPTAATALPQRPHGCTYSGLYSSANMIERTAGRSTLCYNAILLDYLSCSSNNINMLNRLPKNPHRSALMCCTSGLKC